MVWAFNHTDLATLVKGLWRAVDKKSLMIYGTFGIGKSYVVKDCSRELAEEQKREFVEWVKVDKEKKQEVFNNPQKYFVLIDIRLSEYGSEDLKGIPQLDNSEILEWKIPLWEILLQKDDSMGILFLDEFNLASPMVLSSSYKILNDRTIGEGKITNDWSIIGAGNLASDKAMTFELPLPLRDRCLECELQSADSESFTSYMASKRFRKEIIAFINAHSSVMRDVASGDSKMKNTTTRGWERLNDLIKDKKSIDKEYELFCLTSIGEGIASDFLAFCRIQEKMNVQDFINNPKKIMEIKGDEALSLKYFLITCVADQYKDEKLNFKKVMEISEIFDKEDKPEYVTLLWTLCVTYADEKFSDDVEKSSGSSEKLIAKYGKYLFA